jgi:Flp pilus assembly protein TadG
MRKLSNSRGSTVLEFALAGIPMMITFVSIVQMGLTMWTYQSLSYTAKETNRYIAVHGTHCSSGSNNCKLTVANVATAAEGYAIGLSSSKLDMTLTSPSTSYNCNPISSCSSNTNQWPPTADGTVGTAIQVRVQYQVNPAFTMVWPGAKAATYGSYTLGAYSKQRVLF